MKVKICPKCHTRNNVNDKICVECEAKITKKHIVRIT